jgi:hypothetical protein
MDLYVNTIMDVLKNQLLNLYASVTMDVKKPITIYETYM